MGTKAQKVVAACAGESRRAASPGLAGPAVGDTVPGTMQLAGLCPCGSSEERRGQNVLAFKWNVAEHHAITELQTVPRGAHQEVPRNVLLSRQERTRAGSAHFFERLGRGQLQIVNAVARHAGGGLRLAVVSTGGVRAALARGPRAAAPAVCSSSRLGVSQGWLR
jgi:hypothetical protein